MQDWTNAVKAAVVAFANAWIGLILAIAVFVGWEPDLDAFAGLSLAIETFVNAAAGLWILLT
jgi:hypothetical protein